MADFTIKRGDTLPSVVATLSDQNGAINLTSAASVKFIAKSAAYTITGTCVITTPAYGVVTYNWGTSDTANAGDYQMEWEITWSAGVVETVPNDGYKTLTILGPGLVGAVEAILFFSVAGVGGIFSALLLGNKTAALYQGALAGLAALLVLMFSATGALGMALLITSFSWAVHILATRAVLQR